jgi:hypothetical protein
LAALVAAVIRLSGWIERPLACNDFMRSATEGGGVKLTGPASFLPRGIGLGHPRVQLKNVLGNTHALNFSASANAANSASLSLSSNLTLRGITFNFIHYRGESELPKQHGTGRTEVPGTHPRTEVRISVDWI